MKIAIIGAGFSGLALGWYFAHSKLKSATITIFDKNVSASSIAAGLLHPFSGAHAKLNWRGFEGFQETIHLIKTASQASDQMICSPKKGIIRLALNQEQYNDFKRCSDQYPNEVEWLETSTCQKLLPGCAEAPGIFIKNGVAIHVPAYLKAMQKLCENFGIQFIKKEVRSLKEIDDFNLIVVAAGAESLGITELETQPMSIVKGQVLELSWPHHAIPLAHPLNSHVYLVMAQGNTSCLVGATYERDGNYLSNKQWIDIKRAKEELLPKAFALFPALKESKMINCYAGLRAVAKNHQPLARKIDKHVWILSGLGSKGLLYHTLYAKELVEKIEIEYML